MRCFSSLSCVFEQNVGSNDFRMSNMYDPIASLKIMTLKKTMPADSAIVFGDIYQVHGLYTKTCLDLGCERVLLIDSLDTPEWQKRRLEHTTIDFYKGDFSNPFFMASIQETFDIGLAYDVLLHQAPLLSTLHLMIERVEKRFSIVQPMLREQSLTNSLVYLPGNSEELYPLASHHKEFKMFDRSAVNHSHWIWGMTPSFLSSALYGEGFDLIHQDELPVFENNKWFYGAYIFERKRENPFHWANVRIPEGLHTER